MVINKILLKKMKMHTLYIVSLLIVCCLSFSSCDTDKEDYLVTDRANAYISALQLYTADNRNVATNVVIDDEKGIIRATVKNGVNIARLKPRSSLAPEATITPKMGVWTDFTVDVKYTVLAGNGVDKKEYTIIVAEQE